MKLTLLVVLGFALFASCFCDEEAWEHHKEQHGLTYENEEAEAEHKENFLHQLKLVEESKSKSQTRGANAKPVLKLTALSHLSEKDRRHNLFGLLPPPNKATRKLAPMAGQKPVNDYCCDYQAFPGEPAAGYIKPPELDWGMRGALSSLTYSQNPCGSCWAFTGIAVLEAQYNLRYQKKVKLSEEFVRDCAYDKKWSDVTRPACKGGHLFTVYQLASEVAIPTAGDYPYIEDDQAHPCKPKSGITFNITGIARVDGEEKMMEALRTVGPIGVTMDADEITSDKWFGWDGKNPSVMEPKTCTTNVNHAVTLIGYGTDPKTKVKYWLIRNSWGPSWADKGTFKIKRGTCGISYGVYPCIDGKCTLGRNVLG